MSLRIVGFQEWIKKRHPSNDVRECKSYSLWLFVTQPWYFPWPIEIDDLPINFMVIFHSFLYVYQRVANNKILFFALFFLKKLENPPWIQPLDFANYVNYARKSWTEMHSLNMSGLEKKLGANGGKSFITRNMEVYDD